MARGRARAGARRRRRSDQGHRRRVGPRLRCARRIGPAVSVFGSARTPPGHPHYELVRELGACLARAGFAVITGGGRPDGGGQPGRQGSGGLSVGCNIELPREQQLNDYVDVAVRFRHFFARKVMFIRYAAAVVISPGLRHARRALRGARPDPDGHRASLPRDPPRDGEWTACLRGCVRVPSPTGGSPRRTSSCCSSPASPARCARSSSGPTTASVSTRRAPHGGSRRVRARRAEPKVGGRVARGPGHNPRRWRAPGSSCRAMFGSRMRST